MMPLSAQPPLSPASPASPLALVPPPKPKPLTMSPQDAEGWYRRIKASNDHTKTALDDGKRNVQRYKGQYLASKPDADTAVVPSDWWFVKQKLAGLFYRLPDVFLKPLQPPSADAVVVFQAALNEKLGPQGVNALPRIKQTLFDVVCSVGYGACKVGFDPALGEPQPIETGETRPNLARQPGAVLGLSGAVDEPVTQMVPHIIARRYFWEHCSPGDLGVPADFIGLDFDDADFLFVRFREDVKDGDGSSDRQDDERRLTPLSSAAQQSRRKQRTGYEVWFRAARFMADAIHPDHIRTFKIYDDDPDAVVGLRNSPYQQWKLNGQVTDTYTPGAQPVGMVGYPIFPLTLSFISDAWLVPSDCTIAENTASELSKGRTQNLRYRDRSMPQFGFDATRVDKDTQAKIARNDIGAGIPFNGPGADATWPIQKGNFGRERFEFEDRCLATLQQIWGISANQTSVTSEGSKTATELQIIQAASQNRSEQEREAVLGWYLKGVAKFAALLQLFADEEEFVELVGSDVMRLQSVPPQVKAQAQQSGQDVRMLVPWNKDLIQGRFAFAAKANSQLYLDAAQYRKSLMDLYSFFANSPTIDRTPIEREILQASGFDPTKCTKQQPPAHPEPPKISLAITCEKDLNPFSPSYPNTVTLLTQLGITGLAAPAVDPATAMAMQAAAEHPGAVTPVETLSKHHSDLTGGLQGSGAPAPLGAGGHL